MTDCPNGEIRDLLPDLVHGRLDAGERARVEQHVASCDDCSAELALLRDLRSTIRRAPVVDAAAIAAAIPAYRAPVRRSWGSWRAAAAIAAIAVGGTSIALVNHETPTSSPLPPANVIVPESIARPPLSAHVQPPASAPLTPEQVHAPSTTPPETPAGARTEPVALAMTGGAVAELSDRELTTLLDEIESLDALPSEDVEGSGALAGAIPLERTR